MEFIEPDLEIVLSKLSILSAEKEPLWGEMSAQRMVEHLTDTMRLAIGIGDPELEIPEEKVGKAKGFLISEHPMPQNFKASFAKENTALRNDNIQDAISEFKKAWMDFNKFYEENPKDSVLHPNFGMLNHDEWLRLHSKHVTHHLKQFDLI